MRNKPRGATTTKYSPKRGGSLRVLVADDDPDTTSSLCQLVKRWGHDACGARNGAEALELAFAFFPDVLLLDVAMPRVGGCEVARRLRDDRRFEDALLIAVTGYGDFLLPTTSYLPITGRPATL